MAQQQDYSQSGNTVFDKNKLFSTAAATSHVLSFILDKSKEQVQLNKTAKKFGNKFSSAVYFEVKKDMLLQAGVQRQRSGKTGMHEETGQQKPLNNEKDTNSFFSVKKRVKSSIEGPIYMLRSSDKSAMNKQKGRVGKSYSAINNNSKVQSRNNSENEQKSRYIKERTKSGTPSSFYEEKASNKRKSVSRNLAESSVVKLFFKEQSNPIQSKRKQSVNQQIQQLRQAKLQQLQQLAQQLEDEQADQQKNTQRKRQLANFLEGNKGRSQGASHTYDDDGKLILVNSEKSQKPFPPSIKYGIEGFGSGDARSFFYQKEKGLHEETTIKQNMGNYHVPLRDRKNSFQNKAWNKTIESQHMQSAHYRKSSNTVGVKEQSGRNRSSTFVFRNRKRSTSSNQMSLRQDVPKTAPTSEHRNIRAARGGIFQSAVLKTVNLTKVSSGSVTDPEESKLEFMKRNDQFNNNHQRQTTSIPFIDIEEGLLYRQMGSNQMISKDIQRKNNLVGSQGSSQDGQQINAFQSSQMSRVRKSHQHSFFKRYSNLSTVKNSFDIKDFLKQKKSISDLNIISKKKKDTQLKQSKHSISSSFTYNRPKTVEVGRITKENTELFQSFIQCEENE